MTPATITVAATGAFAATGLRFAGLPMIAVVGIVMLAGAIPVGWWAYNDPEARFKNSAQERYKAMVGAGITDERELEMTQSAKARLLDPMMQGFGSFLESVAPSSMINNLDRKILAAGQGGRWTATRLLTAQVIGLIAGGYLGLLILSSNRSGRGFLFALVIAAIGFVIPRQLVTGKAAKRQKQIGKDLADIIDQVTISVEAGLGFDAALARVARDSDSPLAEELGRTMQDVQLGMSRDEAFDALLDRTDVDELRQFIIALQQAARLGMPLGKVLRVQSADLRQRRRAAAEEKAMKLGVKMTFPTVFCILPALLAAILGPAIISIMQNGFGG